MAAGVTLGALEAALQKWRAQVVPAEARDVRVTSVHQDSRRVTPGALFAARQGGAKDGLSFLTNAEERGASAVLVDRGQIEAAEGLAARTDGTRLPRLYLDQIRRSLGYVAEEVYDHPSRSMPVVSVTGTNGKTTVAFLVRQCLDLLGVRCGQLGTLGYFLGDQPARDIRTFGLTTPEADTVSRALAHARAQHAGAFVLEASSHALDQGRIDALRLSVAAFTNLTQDHLDYHHTMDAYANAKARLFRSCAPEHIVLNVDDSFGRELAGEFPAALKVGASSSADLRLQDLKQDPSGMVMTVTGEFGTRTVPSRVVGRHNAENWLVTLGILSKLGVDWAKLCDVGARVAGAPGRLERCDSETDDVSVLVDYAHTHAALERALKTCRGFARGRVICVFGCGGDRDPKKRSKMGEVAGKHADEVWVTNDNPRTESPEKIAEAVLEGVRSQTQSWTLELDRAVAIRAAITSAESGELVLIAGKGHEDYQIIGTERIDFDDCVHARLALAARRANRS